MITSDDVFDRLSDANPHPDISDLVPTSSQLTAFLRELEGDPVETITRPPEPDRKPVRGGLLAAAAAFALVLIVIGAAWLLDNDAAIDTPADTTIATTIAPTTTAPTTEDAVAVNPESQAVLDDFVASYNARDLDGYMSLFAPGITTGIGDRGGRPSPNGSGSGNDFNRSLEQHQAKVAWEMDMDTQLTLEECEGELIVTCTASYDDFFLTPQIGPAQSTLVLGIENGSIVSFRETAINGNVTDDLDTEFIDSWLLSEHGINRRGLTTVNPYDIEYTPASAMRWHVFGRLYAASKGIATDEAPFAPGVALEDLAVAVKFGDALGTTEDKWIDMWDEPTYQYVSGEEYTMDEETVRSANSWAGLTDGTQTLKACEPASGDRILCTYAAEDAFSRAIGMDPYDSIWSFEVVDGRVSDVRLFNGGWLAYAAQVDVFASWATENHPDVGVTADFGEFLYTEANAEAVLSLLDEYSVHVGN